MKKVREYLQKMIELRNLKAEISQIMARYPDSSYESEITVGDYGEIILRMDKIVLLKKSINLSTTFEEEVLHEIRGLVKDMQVEEGIRNG
ncbi:hypothetical protein [Sphingobacterium hotanense]|uniref:Uncharacterized protein n=1 Tax=Sphingobacterium hotanense TaxID=649196 RepID=A0ABT7NLB0_9SPHI|nr:hypothetical protein [Sphingobacterium hotanense]MDM1048040.1 hypothetical protein [Sphingobacterium hotanense]